MTTTQVDDRAFQRSMADIVARSRQLASLFRGPIRRRLVEDQADHAARERGPEGTWAPRAPATRERKRIFRKTSKSKGAIKATYFAANGVLGALPELLQVRATGFSVYARSPIRWAPSHQFGDTVGRGSVIPARPFVYVSVELAEWVERAIGAFVIDGTSRGAARVAGKV